MKNLRPLLLVLTLLLYFNQAKATHIIGGEITYVCLGDSTYQIKLILYRDCTSATPFDTPAYMSVFTPEGEFVFNFTIPAPVISDVPAESENPCLDAPDDICVEQAIYTKTIFLPPSETGYIVVYQRCCRNAGIVNLILPDNTGSTCTQDVPPTSVVECNRSPVFNDFPPTVICLNDAIEFDHSATDADGDSLAYFFYWPYEGATAVDAAPAIASPPPYLGVNWAPGFDELYPITADPAFAINSETGLLTGTATAEGRYVVGVVCKEYRDGVWLGDHNRDFQFNVVACTPLVDAEIEIGDAIFTEIDSTSVFLNCDDYTIYFENNSLGGDTYFWDFGDGLTSTEVNPVHTYTDTGTYYVMLIVNPGFVCADTALGQVGIYNGLAANYSFITGCAGTGVEFNDLSVSTNAGEIIDWDWVFDDGSTSDLQNPEHIYAVGGTYTVSLHIVSTSGCESDYVLEVEVAPGPTAEFDVDDVCQNFAAEFDNQSTIVDGTISGYLWDFGDGQTSTEESPSHFYDEHGTFDVTLITYSANGCTDTITYDVLIGEVPFANAGDDDSVLYLETFTLDGSGVGYFFWTPGNLILPPANISSFTEQDPTAELTETTTFILTVTSPDGCVEKDTVTIFVESYTILEVPNAFSPNGDGFNDDIYILTHDIAELLEYSIFNRYGELVFTTTNIATGWNGTVEGKEAEMGTYIYLVRAYDFGGNFVQRQGNIVLVR